MRDNTEALTTKQRRFIEEYCKDFNASAAAVRAGYSSQGGRQTAHKTLQKPHVAAALAERLGVLTEAADVEAIRLLAELKCVAHFNVQDILAAIQNRGTIEGLLAADREVTAAVSEITVREVPDEDGPESIIKLKFHDKLQAIKLLAQIKQMMSDAQQDVRTVDVRIRVGDVEITDDRPGDKPGQVQRNLPPAPASE